MCLNVTLACVACCVPMPQDGAPRPFPNQVEQAKLYAEQWHMLEQDGRPFMVVSGNHPFRAVYGTSCWTRITAYYTADIIGREFSSFMGPFTDRKALKQMLRDMKERSPTHAVLGFRRYGGCRGCHARPSFEACLNVCLLSLPCRAEQKGRLKLFGSYPCSANIRRRK